MLLHPIKYARLLLNNSVHLPKHRRCVGAVVMVAKKIAILGGGMSALSAAYWLSKQPNWQDKYDITVYQMGWRLGGKAANGHNQKLWHRNEEHGFHLLFGFYENTFATMRACYQELGRASDCPLSEFIAETLEDEQQHPERYAMHRNNHLFLPQNLGGEYKTLNFKFPFNDSLPGDGNAFGILDMIENALNLLQHIDEQLRSSSQSADEIDFQEEYDQHILGVPRDVRRAAIYLAIRAFKTSLVKEYVRSNSQSHHLFHGVVRMIRWHIKRLWAQLKDTVQTDWNSYRLWITEDFIATIICGFFEDDLLTRGFDSINHLNFYEWFMKHGTITEGNQITSESVLMQFGYTACFAFEGGDAVSPRQPSAKPVLGSANMEAGTMLRGGLRLFLHYRGAFDWIFQAGAGDVLAAPMYEVLRQRGVKFEFFHKVKRLVVPENQQRVEAIVLERQATLKNGCYQPLIDVKGLPCWPSEPLYGQLVEGQELQQRQTNLESAWTDWRGEEYRLERGKGFDEVLLSIPVSALPSICEDLIAQNAAWAKMIPALKTVRTIGIQTWLDCGLDELGWQKGRSIGDTGVEPIDMIAEASETMRWENWPDHAAPANLTFFGGVMADDPGESPSAPANYPQTQDAVAKGIAQEYLEEFAGVFWPNAVTAS